MNNLFFLFSVVLLSNYCLVSCTGSDSAASHPRTADEVARAIEKAIHKDDWDNTQWISWTFPGNRQHLLDRERGYAEVKWGDYKALIDVNTQKGIVYHNDGIVEGKLGDSLIQRAWGTHINDAFWLNAPAKLYDEGTQRSLVQRDGDTLLKVEYTTGGVTPGDSYIWHFDENFQPTAWEMYVSVIPTPGAKSTWENWVTLESGARIATHHYNEVGRLTEIKGVKSGNSYKDFGREEDPFSKLMSNN